MKPWTRTRTAVAAGTAAGLLALGTVVPALAQDADPDTSDEAMGYEARRTEFAQRLADKLDLDVEEVTSALDEAVEDLRSELGFGRGFGPGGGRGFGRGFGFGAGSDRYESSSTDIDADPASV